MLRQVWIDLRVRLLGLFGRAGLDARAEEEIQTHIALREQRLIDRGLSAEEARVRARREFGNLLLVRETTLESWPFRVVDDLRQDLRQAVRSLGRAPGFTAAAVLTMALGLGINTGVFTLLNGILFRELPAAAPHELVSIEQTIEGGGLALGGDSTFTISEYRAYRERTRTLSGVLAHADPRETTLGGDAPRKVSGAIVSCNYFDVLGQLSVLGRSLMAEDCEPGADPVVMLGHELWTAAFGADPGILGRAVELDRHRFTVIGVAAEGAYGGSPFETAYFAPITAEPLLWPGESRYEEETARWLYLTGRRIEGASVAEVRAELEVIARQIDRLESGRSTTLAVERATPATVPRDLRGPAAGAAAVLMAAFGLVLLIACANVANLMLARGTARSREVGIRLSLGAGRGRIVRQLLTEGLLIAVAGGVVGSLLAVWSFQALVSLALSRIVPPGIPGIALSLDFSPDLRVFGFAMALTLVTTLMFGLAPALQTSKLDLAGVVKQDTQASGGSRRGGRLREALVGVQVALSMTLMICAGLLLRGLYSTYTTDPGFAYDDVVWVSFGTDYGPAEVLDRGLLEAVAALPGVDAVAYASLTPLGQSTSTAQVRLSGESDARTARLDAVTPDYFSMLELAIVRGRTFSEAESANAGREDVPRPVLVSETTARNFWGEEDPLGRTFLREEVSLGEDGVLVAEDVTLVVVGVAADAQLSAIGSVDGYAVYEPRRAGGELLVRSLADLATTAVSIRTVLEERDPALAVQVVPLEANIGWWQSVSGTVTMLGAGLGMLALALASVGIYGVVSYSVSRRYREIGIRMALGAGASNVLGLILRQTMRPVLVGALAGVALAAVVSRVLSGALFGVSPADPAGFGGSLLFVLGVALVAGFLAARPATRVDPAGTLHAE